MTKTAVARTISPFVGLLAALALVAAALLAGMLTSSGHDQAGAIWNKTTRAGAIWNRTPATTAGAIWNKSVTSSATNGAIWN